MVVFICNKCGESLKKQVVEKHAWKCKGEFNVSCMDCLKDFHGKEYDAHTSCISEAQKYSGKDYVPKANANKGAKKQENWVATIRSITDTKRNLPKGIVAVFDVIHQNDNIPRKMKGFMNFFQNSARHVRKPDVEAAWALIEEEVNRNRQQQADQQKLDAPSLQPTGTEAQNEGAMKRKSGDGEMIQPKQKKLKTKKSSTNGHSIEESKTLLGGETNGNNGTVDENLENIDQTEHDTHKFRWNEVIRSLVISKNNQMKLSKLKKKVLKRYQQFAGSDNVGQVISGKFEKKFNKRILKANLVIENDTVRLVE